MTTSTILQPVMINKAPRYREIAYTSIKEAILAGQLGPNQPLVEEQIAASLTISRTPVREALAILEHEGLIEPRNGRGLYVCAMTRAEFVAIFVANETVEPHLVRRAALLATPAQLEELSGTIERARQSEADHDSTGFLRASRDFHRLVGEASGNLPLTEFVLRNEERTDMYLISAGKLIDSVNMNASNREHAAILGALGERDPEAAARLVVYHAQSLRERLAEHFSGTSAPTQAVGVAT
ncbi:MAG TPA: GntR family transcriptional regulator [Roseiflexaceae bacterium]|nr:GntR family transcriptional regulator [Roseiflexaceae bacterium]